VDAGIRSVDAGALLRSRLEGTSLWDQAGGRAPIDVVAAGKAAGAMTSAACAVLGDRLRRGVVTASRPEAWRGDGLEWIAASHPLPDAGSERAGRRALELAATPEGRAGLLVLLSGGASSMLAVPASGVTLADKIDTAGRLLAAGAPIHALNAVRKHLSGIKAGRLAAAAGPLQAYAVSDVVAPVENDPSVIGSGPTVADPTTFADALQVLDRYEVRGRLPPTVIDVLEAGVRGERPETPKPGDPRLAQARLAIVGTRHQATDGAALAAAARGYLVVTRQEPVVGEARQAGRALVERLQRLAAQVDRPLCLLSSGETTVRVTGDGRGGRNQELVLAQVRPLASFEIEAAVASVGTDGIDGPTTAAGACADTTTLVRATAAGLAEPDAFLARNDSYAYFAALGDLIVTGATSTNVGDLQVALVRPRPND
jgi:hydroxypyruvate reductase